MSLEQIKKSVAAGEGSHLEFKVQTPLAYKIARTMCAFANAKGGHILVGVADDKEIVGVVHPEAEKKRLQEAAQCYVYPPIDLHIEDFSEQFIVVLRVAVKPSNQKPHVAINQNGKEIPYIRVGDKNLMASKTVQKVLANENPSEAFDDPQRHLNSKEKGLVTYLEKRETITIKEFQNLMNLSQRRARRMLFGLVKEGVLRVHEHQKEDYYTLS